MRRILSAALPLLVVAAAATRVGAAPALAWSFDEGQGDVVQGQGPAGKVTGAKWTEGKTGKALEFHGPDYEGPAKPPGTFVRAEGSEGLNPTRTVEISAEVFPTFRPVAWGGIVEKGVGYGSSYRLVMLRSGQVRAAIGNEHLAVDSPEPILLDAWTSVRAVYDGKSLKLYVNEKLAAEEALKPVKLASEHPIEVGRRFTGKIDDVRVSY